MTWIRTIPFEEAEGKVKDLYERIKGPNNNVDNTTIAKLRVSSSSRLVH